jgi:hypothetical protein
MPPKMYICDAHDCIYNMDEGDCIRETVGNDAEGKCNYYRGKR